MSDAARTGHRRPLIGSDLTAATAATRPSIGEWLETARTVVEFANHDGVYDDLADYLKGRKTRR